MAIYHLRATMISRSAGRSATAAAAYRSASHIEDHRTGLSFDYRVRGGVDHVEILNCRCHAEPFVASAILGPAQDPIAFIDSFLRRFKPGMSVGLGVRPRDGLLDYLMPPEGYPDFRPFMMHPSGVRSVEIDVTGQTAADFRRANIEAGHPEWGSRAPQGWTWHHVEDARTMQLVPSIINGTFNHRGGASVARNP